MKRLIQSSVCFLLMLCVLATLCLPAVATEEETQARDLSGRKQVTDSSGFSSINALFDGKLLEGKASKDGASLTIEHEDGIGSLYFLFDKTGGAFTLTDNGSGESRTAGEMAYLHQFVDVAALFGTAPTSVTVNFPNSVTLFELYIYGPGQVPDSVQKWQPPLEGKSELVLFSTHGDDEQLFFAGVLPYYAGELQKNVQVVYFTDHRKDDPHRVHEMLNGLWTVGVTAYPVMPSFPDFFVQYDMEKTYAKYEAKGYTRDELMEYVVAQLRRFQPLVAVGHDVNGEYGHGMHMVYTDLLMEALDLAANPEAYPESAEQYGLWDTPKAYLHMYEENQIVMKWDQPLERFGGMTPYEVSRDLGYPCHASQYKDFAWYYRGSDTALDVKKYNPCYYGLFRTTVGEDVAKDDFFENLPSRAEFDRLEEEKRLEAERLAAEEEARRREEAERLAEQQRRKEEEARRESEAAAREEQARQESIAREEQARKKALERQARLEQELKILTVAVGILLVLLVVLLVLRGRGAKKRATRRKRRR